MKTNKKIIIILIFFSIVVLIFYLLSDKTTTPKVINTVPSDKSINIIESAQISVNFNEDIENSDKEDISIIFSPNIEFETAWFTNLYKVVPTQDLKNNTLYNARVLYKNKEIYNFRFETQLFTNEDVLKYGPTQTENDKKFAEATIENIKRHPWFTSLPIKTNNYVIFYDFDNEKFAVTLLSEINNLDDISAISNEIELKLKSIGVPDPKNYYFNFVEQN